MAKPNRRLKRPDGLGRLYKYKSVVDEEGNEKILTLPIEKTIEDNYVYLYRAMKEDEYYLIPQDSCFFFKEIVADGEVVGFATALFESSILIQYPSHDMVSSLIKHKLARVFDDRFVISKIPFVVPIVPVMEAIDGVYSEAYPYGEKIYRKLSLIYDLDLCAVVGLASDTEENDYVKEVDPDAEDTNMNDYNIISLPLRIDDVKYGCIQKRKNDADLIDNTYFKKVRTLLDENDEVIENWLSIR